LHYRDGGLLACLAGYGLEQTGKGCRERTIGTEPGDRMPTVPKSPSVVANSPDTSASRRAMAIVMLLFFMWGLLTSLNDIPAPHLKAIFDLKYVEAILIQFSFFSAYFILAMPSGRLIECVGYKRTMVLGLLIMGTGALLFIPAAGIPSFPLFLTALTVLGGGITALQVSANPYVAVLGPPRTASSRLNLTQAFNSLGTTVAPLLGGLLILGGAPKSSAEMHRLAAAELQGYRL
jgi:MFS transporter, FHS family, L-fucose permease